MWDESISKEILEISYDDNFNTISSLDSGLFNQIVQLVFEEAIVHERINTRNVLSDIEGICPLLETARGNRPENNTDTDHADQPTGRTESTARPDSDDGNNEGPGTDIGQLGVMQ